MTQVKIHEVLKDINEAQHAIETSIDDVSTNIGGLDATLHHVIGDKIEMLIDVLTEKNLGSSERAALDKIEEALAARNKLKQRTEDIAHSILTNGYADVYDLGSASITFTLARKYHVCSVDLYFARESCGTCQMRIFASKEDLHQHLVDENTKKRRRASEISTNQEVDDDGVAWTVPQPLAKRVNKNSN